MISSLNGNWEFYDSDEYLNLNDVHFDNRIEIPSCTEEFLEAHKEHMFFKKNFVIDFDSEKRYFLNFDAIDYHADVYVNKKFLGSHDSGYTPFSFEITGVLKEKNELVVHVSDPTGESATKILHGKQNGIPDWYGNISGIWRDVFVEERGQNFFDEVFVEASYFSKNLKVRGKFAEMANGRIKLSLFRESSSVLERALDVDSDDFEIEGSIESPKPWSPEEPNLYGVKLELEDKSGYLMDTWERKIGFRDVEASDGKIFLNGKELFVFGALDQDLYPLTFYTTPSVSYVKDEFSKAKAMGLNLLRCHIKVPDRRYLDLADEMGILIWEEIPNADKFSEKSSEESERTMREIARRDYNHPSFVIFTVINESWGIDLSESDQREWLSQMYEKTKATIGNRLVVDNSACQGNFHLKTDINDFHFYSAFPDHVRGWNENIRNFAERKVSTFSKYGDSKENETEPLMVSEFGVWGLPAFIRDSKRMGRAFRGIKETIPEGVTERFFDSSISRCFPDFESFAILTQKAQFNGLKYQIEEMRLFDSIKGYVVTEFTDAFWEANGLLDMQRRPKEHFDLLKMLNSPLLPIPRSDRYSFFEDETIPIDLGISDLSGGKSKKFLSVSVDGKILSKNEISIKEGVEHVPLSLKAKECGTGFKKIWFGLADDNGTVSRNYMDVAVFNRTDLNESSLTVLKKPGKHVFGDTEVEVLDKKDSLSGDWISGFNWIDPSLGLSEDGMMDIRHAGFLKSGLTMKIEGNARILSGTTYGWLYGDFANVAIVETGRERKILTTLSIENDPIGKALSERIASTDI